MDLTEPQAGSDLGGIVTRATSEGDRWFIDGEKIFITNGGAQIHLVLARDAATFDQSKGTTNGLNLMLCPQTLPDGRPQRRARGAGRVEARHPRLADVRHRVRARRGVPARHARGRASAPCSTS